MIAETEHTERVVIAIQLIVNHKKQSTLSGIAVLDSLRKQQQKIQQYMYSEVINW